ncbi:uncharacterized protein DFL_005300 [Arthrobotrys flagrans]|uniref:Uncharacterized protein n=1 Tax=Arthrobotrys flagrans TaxID=97331 RepID=A0A437A7F2_ARTFL|nr:hypothetical protein DFL_005300 [Arthrobotrys flagrans]
MAPRRGGGIGVSIDNQCSRYDAFSSDITKAQIGILGGFLLCFFILAYCTASRSGKRKKAGQEKSILRWYQYGIAIFLIIAWFIMSIVNGSLAECGAIGVYDSSAISTATVVTQRFTELYLLGLVLFVVVKRLFQLAGSTGLKRTMVILGAIFFVIVSIVFLAYIILYCLIQWDVDSVSTVSGIIALARLTQAYVVLYFLLVIFAVVGLVLAWIRLAMKPERKQGVTSWIPVLIICLLGFSLYNVISVFLIYYDPRSITNLTLTIGFGIQLLFFFGAWFSIFMIARGEGWDFLRLQHDIQPQYNMGAPPPMMSPYSQTPYDTVQSPDAAKRMSFASHGNAPTPAPPYMGGTGMAYSGNGVYEPQGQTYQASGWNSGGYAPVGQTSTGYSAPVGAASRGMEANELMGGR